MSAQKHEPTLIWASPESHLNGGSNWAHVPACPCGWRGQPTFEKGEATRKAYAHVQAAGSSRRAAAEREGMEQVKRQEAQDQRVRKDAGIDA